MENWIEWIQQHAEHAHWILLLGTLLAGLSLPISIDLLMITSAILAATIIPDRLIPLFFSMLIGCLFSAWIAYTLGRFVGPKLSNLPLLSKILHPKRIEKIGNFYAKHGPYALILGRFIPFGVRNCLYISSGISKMPFLKFILWDGVAVILWSFATFSLYYMLGKNIEILYTQMKWVNLSIFALFGVTVIGIIWYKKKQKTRKSNV